MKEKSLPFLYISSTDLKSGMNISMSCRCLPTRMVHKKLWRVTAMGSCGALKIVHCPAMWVDNGK